MCFVFFTREKNEVTTSNESGDGDLSLYYYEFNPQVQYIISDKYYQLLKEEKIAIGMNKEMVKLALGTFYDSNRVVTASGTTEQWRYEYVDNYDRLILHFENDILTSFEEN